MEEHCVIVQRVLERLREHRIYINCNKSEWGVKRLEFLGFLIGDDKVEITDAKKQALRDYDRGTQRLQTTTTVYRVG